MTATEKDQTKKEEQGIIQAFAKQIEELICTNTYPTFDKDGKPILAWNTDGYQQLQTLVKETTEE